MFDVRKGQLFIARRGTMNARHYLTILIILVLAHIGCAKHDNPVSPEIKINPGQTAQAVSQSHKLLAFNLFKINPKDLTVDVIPIRNVADHWNVLGFLERWPCATCVTVTGVTPVDPNMIKFDVKIIHPFTNMSLTGFDVKGIAMFEGDMYFPGHQLVTSSNLLGNYELINADGYTTLYNPTTWGKGPGGLQGYSIGKMSTTKFPNSTLNGYKTYESSDAANSRRAFFSGDAVIRPYDIFMPDDVEFVLGYAVDACWAPPTTVPVTDPMVDFPISANAPEPYEIDLYSELPWDALTPNGGYLRVQFFANDFGGPETYETPIMECPELFDGILTADHAPAPFPGDSHWRFQLENMKGAEQGLYKALISVEDKLNESSPDHLNLTAYGIADIKVSQPGWVRTWGSDYIDYTYDVVGDPHGNFYVTGMFYNTVDLDPGDGVQEYTSMGYEDAFLSKFDPDGNLVWTRVWGADYHEAGLSLELHADYVYVCGYFNNTVDFDPGPEVTEFSSHGDWDSYMSKFDTDGNLQWAQAWGSQMWDKALDLSVIYTGIYVCGFFRGTCDFDPGPGEDVWSSNPGASYVSKFDHDGNHVWTRAWSGNGSYDDLARSVSTSGEDGEPLVYIGGEFDGTMDLDPGGGSDLHTSTNVYQDVYLCCLDDFGNYQWGVTWGGDGDDHIYSVESELHRITAVGNYLGTVDFDPGTLPGQEDIHTAVSGRDAFFTEFTNEGNHKITRTWGGGDGIGNDDDTAYRIFREFTGKYYIVGTFHDTVDFGDSDYMETEFASNGEEDIFVLCFKYGDLEWVRTVGGPGQDMAWGVCFAQEMSDRFVYVAGSFNQTVDFNPYTAKYEVTSLGLSDSCLVKYRDGGHW